MAEIARIINGRSTHAGETLEVVRKQQAGQTTSRTDYALRLPSGEVGWFMESEVEIVDFAIGERVVLDNQVPGAVDGYYTPHGESLSYVMFKADWTIGKYVYGGWRNRKSEPEGEILKLTSFTLILVHPSNLKPEPSDG